jgi:lysophospholipase L1-like esterase
MGSAFSTRAPANWGFLMHLAPSIRALGGALVLLLTAGAAVDARAGEGDPEVEARVQRLRSEPLQPATRSSLIDWLADPSRDIHPHHISTLLEQGASWTSQIDGANLAAARQDPELIPVMFRAFLQSKSVHITFDPDIFERLLRALQAFPPEELRARMEGANLAYLAEASHQRLVHQWLQPLTDGWTPPARFTLTPELRRVCTERAHSWIDALLARGDEGLVTLQTDSGEAVSELLRELEEAQLAALVRSGSLREARLAIEVVLQRQAAGEVVRDALTERIERDRDPGLAVLAARLPPIEPRSGQHHLHPVRPLAVGPAAQDWTVDPGPAPWPPWIWLLLVATACTAAWAAALRRAPERRPLLFRLGAVALAPALFLLLEGALALVGVEPPRAHRPSFNPYRAPERLFVEADLEGVPYAVSADGRSRYLAFTRRKAPGTLRVFTLGESSVHATHYLLEEGFSAVLERRLDASIEGVDVEVINAGVGGALSDEVVYYAAEAAALDADLLVLYLGNNDLDAIPRLARYRAFSPTSVSIRFAVDRLRIASLLRPLVAPRAAPDGSEGVDDGAFWDDEPLSPAERSFLLELAERNARSNLERVVRQASEDGIDTILVVQGQNDVRCAPQDGDLPDHCFGDALRRIAEGAAARSGAVLVDGAGALRAHAGGGTEAPAGWDYYYDSIHPTRLGHAVLGEAIAPTAEALLRRR